MPLPTYPGHSMGQGFQSQVYPGMAPGVEGDFCSHNSITTVDAGPGGLICGPEGLIVARFAWLEYSMLDPNNAPQIATNYSNVGFQAPAGFIHREQQGTMINWLGGASMWVPPGYMITLFNNGDFFVINRGDQYCQLGMKAYADLSNGNVMFGNAGASPYSSTFTGNVTAKTSTFNGSVFGNTLTVDNITSGGVPIVVGAEVTGAGLPPGVRITKQTAGNQGDVGEYTLSMADLSIPPPVPPAPTNDFSANYGELNVTALTAPGMVGLGQVLQPIPAPPGLPTRVTQFGTGTGGLGTYYTDNPTAGAFTGAATAVETKWRATSAGGPGVLVKMSSWV